MLVAILLLSFAVRMGNAHQGQGQGQPSITRLLARQTPATSTATPSAFKPPAPTDILSGSCQSNGYTSCGSRLCIDSKNGDTCCDPKASYACVSGSYCFVNGFCCPNEIDPETCARNTRQTLPADFSRSAKSPSSTQASSTRPSSSSNTGKTSSASASRTSTSNTGKTSGSNTSQTSSSNTGKTSSSNTGKTSSSSASRTSSSNTGKTSGSNTGKTSSSNTGKASSSNASRTSSSKPSQASGMKNSQTSGSNTSKAPSGRPSTTYPEPSSYPTVNEDSVAPKEAAPVTTTYGPITATISDNPVTLSYSGEVLPIQTVANHRPAPSSFKDGVLAALAKDPATKAFGDFLTQVPSVFEGLEENKEYYVFAPSTQSVIAFLKYLQDDPQRLARRKVLAPPELGLSFSEKPKGAPDIKRVSTTLKTTLVGETKYVDLGAGEGARVVSNPTVGENGTVHVISGFGNSTLVYADDIPFQGGVIKKCDGFFTLPHALETVFANTSGRSWSTALQNADLLTQLSSKPMVTIFAVQDSVLDPANLPGSADLNRLIYDGLSYTPDMSDGSCLTMRGGGSLRITRQGNDILVNGVRISTPDVISKNGVIQYLEQIPPAEQCTPSDSGAGVQGHKKSAGSVPVVSRMAVLSLSVASLAAYFWV